MTFFAARREIKVQRKTICKSPKKKEHRSHFITFREQKKPRIAFMCCCTSESQSNHLFIEFGANLLKTS